MKIEGELIVDFDRFIKILTTGIVRILQFKKNKSNNTVIWFNDKLKDV